VPAQRAISQSVSRPSATDLDAADQDFVRAAVPEAPITPQRVDLGRLLFFDPRLTVDADVSCSSCHPPPRHGTDRLPKSIGVRQRPHPRNAPTVLNAGLNFIIHWRGDRDSLEDQVIKALASPRVQLGVTLGDAETSDLVAFLESLTGELPANFATVTPLPPGSVTRR
jgi:cytochrome c peroxidase